MNNTDLEANETSKTTYKHDWVRATAEWQQERFDAIRTKRQRLQESERCSYPEDGKWLCELECGQCEHKIDCGADRSHEPMEHVSGLIGDFMQGLTAKKRTRCDVHGGFVLLVANECFPAMDKLSLFKHFVLWFSALSFRVIKHFLIR